MTHLGRYLCAAALTVLIAVCLPLSGHTQQPPQRREIYLARHGQTEWNRRGRVQGDPDLNAVGYEQRVHLYLLMHDVALRGVFSSALQRTKSTAALTAQDHQLDVIADADLNELEGGVFEGVCYTSINNEEQPLAAQSCRPELPPKELDASIAFLRAERSKRHRDKYGFRPLGGESYLDGAGRVERFWARHRSRLLQGPVLIVAHAGSNRLLLAKLMGWDSSKVVRIRQENHWVFRVVDGEKGAVLSVYRDGEWRLCLGEPDEHKGLDCTQDGGDK